MKPIRPEVRDRIAKAYQVGANTYDIAATFHVSQASVTRIAASLGMHRRTFVEHQSKSSRGANESMYDRMLAAAVRAGCRRFWAARGIPEPKGFWW